MSHFPKCSALRNCGRRGAILFVLFFLVPIMIGRGDLRAQDPNQVTKTAHAAKLRLAWANSYLTITGAIIPNSEHVVKIWYLEAFCRPGSTDRVWNDTVIDHKTRLVKAAPDGSRLELQSVLADGVVVDHVITAHDDEVDFQLLALNPTKRVSQAHWFQPCVRVSDFVGVPDERNGEKYLPKVFIYLDGQAKRLPTQPWAVKARYVPGQVWGIAGVPRDDLNPRPLSTLVPSHGLMGCFSQDESLILATAWEPCQELFQGVVNCIHADPRLGGLKPGETKPIRGKVYLVKPDTAALLRRYERDFPQRAADQIKDKVKAPALP